MTAARRTLAELRSAAPDGPAEAADLSGITSAVAIVASSRGGSSLLHQILSDQPDVLSISGEHTALYKLNRLDRGPDGSDALEPDVAFDRAEFSRDFMSLLGSGPARFPSDAVGLKRYAAVVTRRLALQWPLEQIGYPTVEDAVTRALRTCPGPDDPDTLFAAVLQQLRADHPRLDPCCYDLPPALRGRPADDALRPPHDGYCIEEPPFVVPRARTAAGPDALRRHPVVIKSSVDAYRLPLLRRLMPNARIRVIHLTRNPAASVNGLYDGWRDRGFFSYDVSEQHTLSIDGYSELGSAARRWWNFDIPPGWGKFVDQPLERVCAHQWAGAHRAALDGLGPDTADAVLRVPFERILDPGTREPTLRSVFAFAGIPQPPGPVDFPVVMATARPRPARWRRRADLVLPALDQPAVRAVADELGYHQGQEERWL
ncbi:MULTISPECIES: sulfotransferase [Streptacidiphilus]|uniref:Sulfotransferase n=1 Tax=Streptacidiphilus cavernicola TaxID=3342716 RepID=A0ABV6UU04_9ACTN|nr:sulfotransferase [Streptacidiphilus jeojiense]